MRWAKSGAERESQWERTEIQWERMTEKGGMAGRERYTDTERQRKGLEVQGIEREKGREKWKDTHWVIDWGVEGARAGFARLAAVNSIIVWWPWACSLLTRIDLFRDSHLAMLSLRGCSHYGVTGERGKARFSSSIHVHMGLRWEKSTLYTVLMHKESSYHYTIWICAEIRNITVSVFCHRVCKTVCFALDWIIHLSYD